MTRRSFFAAVGAAMLGAVFPLLGSAGVSRYVDPFIGTSANGHVNPGASRVPEATIALPGGKSLRIVSKGLSKGTDVAFAVTLNGKPLTSSVIRHEDLLQGGELVFGQDDCASKTGPQNVPDLLPMTEKHGLLVQPQAGSGR